MSKNVNNDVSRIPLYLMLVLVHTFAGCIRQDHYMLQTRSSVRRHRTQEVGLYIIANTLNIVKSTRRNLDHDMLLSNVFEQIAG